MITLTAPLHKINSTLKVAGSKSISNRCLVMNELLRLNRTFNNVSNSEDTQLLLKAFEQIKNKNTGTINVHHAGTDMRFLTAVLSVTEGEWILTGSERMKQRPIGELVSALKVLGANIEYLEKENFPPLKLNGSRLQGGSIEIDSSISSQFVSALLLAGSVFEKGLTVKLKGKVVSRPYIDMTIALLKEFGVLISESQNTISLKKVDPLNVKPQIVIESDWSSASYWYSICALAQQAEIVLRNFNIKSLQADSVLPEIYKELGVRTIFKENSIILSHMKPTCAEFNYDFTNCPDIAQTIAVTCFGLGISAKLTGLSTLKLKETDRILALKTELEKMGARVEISSTTLSVLPLLGGKSRTLNKAAINTYNDHRMAMSFAPLALVYKNISINDPEVVNKSYPEFWDDLKSVGFSVNLQP